MKIRLANLSDIDGITSLHCNSFDEKNHVPMMLGKSYVKSTYKWLIKSKISYVLVYEIDLQIAGVVAVCDRPFTKDMFIACLPDFIFSILNKPQRIFSKLLWSRLARKSATNDGSLLEKLPNFAQMTIGMVDPKFRGLGVFSKLIAETIKYSELRNSKIIRAGVYKSNLASRQVFINSGWFEIKKIETIDTVFYGYLINNDYLGIVD
jgi:hypothetical protein